MPLPRFADISHHNSATIDWPAYLAWASAGDGIARLCCKATEGRAYKDPNLEIYARQALLNEVGTMMYYHYARADLNPGQMGAAQEARWFMLMLAGRQRSGDLLMLDFEQAESAAWAHAFYDKVVSFLPAPIKLILYDSHSHFMQFFAQDRTLADKYDAAIAAYHPLADGPPFIPSWWHLAWWQYTDKEQVPGIGLCDANLFYGGSKMQLGGPYVWPIVGREIPTGTTFQQVIDTFGLAPPEFMALNSWASSYNLDLPIADGTEVKLPGYYQAGPAPVPEPLADRIRSDLKAWLA